jgi:hypothetical protein
MNGILRKSLAAIISVAVFPVALPADTTREADVPASPVVETPGEWRGQVSSMSEWNLPVELDPKVRIAKVYDFLNDREKTPTGGNRAIEQEFKYFNHGAVTKEQLRQRRGYYFIVSWANEGEAADFQIRFDFRQRHTRDQVRTLEIPARQARGSQKVRFSVTGDAYEEAGPITSWRVSIVKQGRIVAQQTSFIW